MPPGRSPCPPRLLLSLSSWTELQYFVSHGSKHKWLREDAMLEQIHWATNRRNKWKNLAVFAFDRDPSRWPPKNGPRRQGHYRFQESAFRAAGGSLLGA